MYTSKQKYDALQLESDSTYRQTKDNEGTTKSPHHTPCNAVYPKLSWLYQSVIFILLITSLFQGFWLYHLHYQLHPVKWYSSSKLTLTAVLVPGSGCS